MDSLSELSYNPKLQQSHNALEVGSPSHSQRGPLYSKAFVSARALQAEAPWSPPPTQIRSQEKSRREFITPFIPPETTEIQLAVRENTSEPCYLTSLDDTSSSPAQELLGTNTPLF
jgi:hypothetical protein